VLRQTGRIAANIETPVLVIAAGLLTLAAQSRLVPRPTWIVEEGRQSACDDPPRPS